MANKYGEAALLAGSKKLSRSSHPITQWDEATKLLFPNSPSSQHKGCPRGAFLGLCEEGFVRNFPVGSYTSSKDNKAYAIRAVQLLRSGGVTETPTGLWREVMGGVSKRHNSQMDVVLALWINNLIVSE